MADIFIYFHYFHEKSAAQKSKYPVLEPVADT